MKNSILIFATIALSILSGCNQTKLTNDDAKALITNTLNLPVTYRHDINKRPSMGSGFELDGLREAGLITGSEYLDSRRLIEIQITELGQSSFIGENDNAYMFKTNDIDFDQITGISINKEEQTATVRFSLKAKNATLAAYALAKTKAGFSGNNYINYSLINPLNGELAFKKFDNGWQLLEQGKSNSELLNQILKSDANSNTQDDYSSQVSDIISEIYSKNNPTQARYAGSQEFFDAFKQVVLAKDMNKISDFVFFPFEEQGSVLSKENFIKNFKFTDDIFELIKKAKEPYIYEENHFTIEGTGMGFSKHSNGYWKWDDINYGE